MAKSLRRTYRPQYRFTGGFRLTGLYPTFVRPVIPGETLRNYYAQHEVIGRPLVKQGIGGHYETFLFYVPYRALHGVSIDDLDDLFDDPATNLPSHNWTGRPEYLRPHYHNTKLFNLAYAAIYQTYFDRPGDLDDWTSYRHPIDADGDKVERAQLIIGDALVSAIQNLEAGGDVSLDIDSDGTITAEEAAQIVAEYWLRRRQGESYQDYDTFLRRNGIRLKTKRSGPPKPELLAHSRHFQMPTVRYDNASAAMVSRWHWKEAVKRSKDFFFAEPGMLYGLSLIRPSVYWKDRKASAAGRFDLVKDFDPNFLRNVPQEAWRPVDDFLENGTATMSGHIHRHMYLAMGESLHGKYEGLGYVMDVSPTSLDGYLWPSLSDLEAMISGTDKFFPAQVMHRLDISSPLALPDQSGNLPIL